MLSGNGGRKFTLGAHGTVIGIGRFGNYCGHMWLGVVHDCTVIYFDFIL